MEWYRRPSDGTIICATVRPDRSVEHRVVYGEELAGGLNAGVLEAFWEKMIPGALRSHRSAAETNMISIYNKIEQCRSILRQVRLAHPGVELPIGAYGCAYRRLDRACLFLEAELEGLMRDIGFDPSAGDPQSAGAPDGKEEEKLR